MVFYVFVVLDVLFYGSLIHMAMAPKRGHGNLARPLFLLFWRRICWPSLLSRPAFLCQNAAQFN